MTPRSHAPSDPTRSTGRSLPCEWSRSYGTPVHTIPPGSGPPSSSGADRARTAPSWSPGYPPARVAVLAGAPPWRGGDGRGPGVRPDGARPRPGARVAAAPEPVVLPVPRPRVSVPPGVPCERVSPDATARATSVRSPSHRLRVTRAIYRSPRRDPRASGGDPAVERAGQCCGVALDDDAGLLGRAATPQHERELARGRAHGRDGVARTEGPRPPGVRRLRRDGPLDRADPVEADLARLHDGDDLVDGVRPHGRRDVVHRAAARGVQVVEVDERLVRLAPVPEPHGRAGVVGLEQGPRPRVGVELGERRAQLGRVLGVERGEVE